MPVSFHQDVAKIFAYHCNGCHGQAGGLNLRTYRAVIEGGNKGKVIIAGDPENSLIIHFVEGRRGPAHRMPAGGAPLSAQQTATLRQWIAEGAREDAEPVPPSRELAGVTLPASITVTAPAQAYLTLSALNSATGQVLWTESASIKSPKEENDAAPPGQPIHWELRPAPGWPATITLRLTAQHSINTPSSITLAVVALGPPQSVPAPRIE